MFRETWDRYAFPAFPNSLACTFPTKRSLYNTYLQPAIETIPAYDQNGQATKLATVGILAIHEQDLSFSAISCRKPSLTCHLLFR